MSRAVGLALGFAADALWGDPQRGHPVAAFGSAAHALERRTYGDSRTQGVVHVAALVGAAYGVGRMLDRRGVGTLTTAACTWAVLGGRSLAYEAATIHGQLARNDVAAAREQVTHLVGRDPSQLDAQQIARATIESVAENTSDAVVAPLFWGALLGPAGLLGYRAANTLDAMVGHRSPRYRNFGWASARLDDLLNLAPARVAALSAAAAAPIVGGQSQNALQAWRNDASKHPSPNAGPVESAFAGALGIQLGGTNTYAGKVEDRGTLGIGRTPEIDDIRRANRLARAVNGTALVFSVGLASRAARRRPS